MVFLNARTVAAGILAAVLTACTATSTTVTSAPAAGPPVSLDGARVAVLPFTGESGQAAREITMRTLAQQHRAAIVSPSAIDAYLRENAVTPSEFDVEALNRLGRSVGADAVLWGTVDQYTPYSFGRLAPATPPYVDLTLRILQTGATSVSVLNAHKQGGLPATIWSRQPTFDDVAQVAISDALKTR